jgi:4-amino-4-deoxy-L-arabinose transferase-like glycosyltransferase
VLYHGIWVDRPQGLLLTFRGLLELGGGSTESMRLLAAVVAAAVLLASMWLALRLGGRIEAAAVGLLLATVGASPWIESFTLSGELLASLPSVLALVCFSLYLRTGRVPPLVLTGLLTGCAVMVKQSAFDAGLAAAFFLILTRRRQAASPIAVLVGAALVPVAIGLAAAAHPGDWWHAVVGYRAQDDSLLTGSVLHHLWLFVRSLPAAAAGLAVLAVLAAAGWRWSPLLARVWLVAAIPGVVFGGNFHPHYYLQLVPPLALLGAFGVHRLHDERHVRYTVAAAGAAVATLAVTAPLWFAGGSAQARWVWPRDPHLRQQAALAAYVRAHTRPGDRVYAVWAAADLYYLADRRPVIPYMWYRNVEAVPGALSLARRALVEGRPALVLEVQRASALDVSGQTAAILRRHYRRSATVAGVPVLRPVS